MPPIIYETVAWFRRYSWLPLPPLPGESDAAVAADPLRSAYAAPIAGALTGLLAGVAMVVAAALGASDYVAAATGVVALLVVTGGRAEQILASIAGGRAGAEQTFLNYGIVAIAVAVLLRTGALDALLFFGPWSAAFALAGACAAGRGAALGFMLLRPETPESAETAVQSSALQRLAISGLALAIVPVLLFFGLGAAVAGVAAAAGAVALVSAFLPYGSADDRLNFVPAAEIAAEIAFLIAVAAFAGS